MPQLGKVLIGKHVTVTLTQLIGIYLWELHLADTDLVANLNLAVVANQFTHRPSNGLCS